VIYAAFSVYMLGILFAGMGVYRLWGGLIRPRWLNWALLPGTVVSEMAYIFGCLITGGEVRRARLMGSGESGRGRGKSAEGAEAEPTTEAEPKLRVVGPLVAALMSILACVAGILLTHSLLGKPVIETFTVGGHLWKWASLPKALPTSTGGFWDLLSGQVELLRRMSATWGELDWLNWRVPLFVYLSGCLTIRLAPVRRSLRATLGAVVVLAGLIALVGAVFVRFADLMNDLWPLVTYLWSAMLFLLCVSLLVRGAVGLVRCLIREGPAA